MKRVASIIMGIGLLVPAGGLLARAADGPLIAPSEPSTSPSPTFDLEADGVSFGTNTEQVARLYDRYWDQHFVARYR
jgi:hypothetical protein